MKRVYPGQRQLARLTAMSLQPWHDWMDLVREETGNLAVERIEAQRAAAQRNRDTVARCP